MNDVILYIWQYLLCTIIVISYVIGYMQHRSEGQLSLAFATEMEKLPDVW